MESVTHRVSLKSTQQYQSGGRWSPKGSCVSVLPCVLKRGREGGNGVLSYSLNGMCFWLLRAAFFPALPEELGGDPFKRTPLHSTGNVKLIGIQLEALTSTRGPAPSSSEPEQGACGCTVQPGCDPEQGQWWRMSGTQPWPALVLPDVCFDEVISNAKLWDRSFAAFIRGSSEKQYCSACQPCPFW